MAALVWFALLSTIFLVLVAAFVSIPRWFARSLHRHRMWRLRDALVEDMLEGVLPREHPAVGEMLMLMDSVLEHQSQFNMKDYLIFSWSFKGISWDSQRRFSSDNSYCSLDNLGTDQREKLKAYRWKFMVLAGGSLLLGSWIGLIVVFRFLVPILASSSSREIIRNIQIDNRLLTFDIPGNRTSACLMSNKLGDADRVASSGPRVIDQARAAGSAATDQATCQSKLGQRSIRLVERNLGAVGSGLLAAG